MVLGFLLPTALLFSLLGLSIKVNTRYQKEKIHNFIPGLFKGINWYRWINYRFSFKQQDRSSNNLEIDKNDSAISIIDANIDLTRWKNHIKIEKSWRSMILLMTVSFYITWTPYATESTLTMIGFNISHLIKIFAILLTKIGIVINPLLFRYFEKKVMIFIYLSYKNI